ncbi:BTAD domain-containing putative transcriptional regulator [Asanoa sp. WMMD1127]|uniref:AfsR/SARP family transcriptional regulator n=1 Tax=Asanoa sp. WMMD1127 TaxID=3016107 RepID=UPI0024176FD4|nr:AfsR/SARP family transcriptional regulator [Asanoa sp. WMMD1127]MDG4825038.1 BTAD domain-containing putative transcriptional regulator [Asanoa sp. WMMD1127]
MRATGPQGPVAVGGVKSQSILAALLLEANRVVPMQRLIAAAWDDDPPAGAQTQVRNRISALRRAFRDVEAATEVIVTSGSGYALRTPEQRFDLGTFEAELARARFLRSAGDAPRAREALADALGLWRGSTLDGLTAPLMVEAAERIDQRRMGAVEVRIELDLELGRAAELVPELTELTVENPYREGLHALLMLALHRAGRQAEAMAVFRRIRRELVDQLGVEPGPELQRLHRALLDGGPVTLSKAAPSRPAMAVEPARTVVPRELPAAVPGFAGRHAALHLLRQRLPQPSAPTTLTVITGIAGIGKTALAVKWAHEMATAFPDGHVYLDLRGDSLNRPMDSGEALGRLLRSLGVSAEAIPVDVAEAANRFRSVVSGRRVLLLLDNAVSEDQVRPLLPGNSGSVVLVTSRSQLTGLVTREGAAAIPLHGLTGGEAQEVLTHLVGAQRVHAEAHAAGEFAKLCGGVPLAIRSASATLIRHHDLTIASQVEVMRVAAEREPFDAVTGSSLA